MAGEPSPIASTSQALPIAPVLLVNPRPKSSHDTRDDDDVRPIALLQLGPLAHQLGPKQHFRHLLLLLFLYRLLHSSPEPFEPPTRPHFSPPHLSPPTTPLHSAPPLIPAPAPLSPPPFLHQTPTSPPPPPPHNALQSHLFETGLLQGALSDVHLLCFGHVYRLHSIVLAQSVFFTNLLSGGFSEERAGPRKFGEDNELIEIGLREPMTRAAFEFSIARMYGGGPALVPPPWARATPLSPLSPAFERLWSKAAGKSPSRDAPPSTSPTTPTEDWLVLLSEGVQPATPTFLISLLATATYLEIPFVQQEVFKVLQSTITPWTVSRYLSFALGHGLGPSAYPTELDSPCRGLESVGTAYSTARSRTSTNNSTTSFLSSAASASSSSFDDPNATVFVGPEGTRVGEAVAMWLAKWGTDVFLVEEWLAASGTSRSPNDDDALPSLPTFDQLCLIRNDVSPTTGHPYVPDRVITSAFFSAQELKLKIPSTSSSSLTSHALYETPRDNHNNPTNDSRAGSPSTLPTESTHLNLAARVNPLLDPLKLVDNSQRFFLVPFVPLEPFRISLQFWNVAGLQDKQRIYSNSFFYLGSAYNCYLQRLNKRGLQLGIYLHRQNHLEPLPDPSRAGGPGSSPFGSPSLLSPSPPSKVTPVPYVDKRKQIQVFFSLWCPNQLGVSVTRFSSGPDSFAVSQSWGWKSSSLRSEEYLGSASLDLPTTPGGTQEANRFSSLRVTLVMGVV
ncbi:hypothetical protein RQP46_007506 [Phenoliferia psychrophenolica]